MFPMAFREKPTEHSDLPARVFWTDVRGHRLFGRELGPNNGSPLVLVHGVVVSGRYWLPAARELARRGFRVLVPDLPGSGNSEKTWPPLGVAASAEVLFGWLDSLHIDGAADFAGNSFGCQILIEAALRYRNRISHLILQGPTVDPHHRSLQDQLWALIRDIFLEPGVLRVVLPDYLRAGPRRAFAMSRIALADRPERKLEAVEPPCLILRGALDPLVSPEWARQATDQLGAGELKTIDGAAHALNYTHPSEFADAIGNFVNDR